MCIHYGCIGDRGDNLHGSGSINDTTLTSDIQAAPAQRRLGAHHLGLFALAHLGLSMASTWLSLTQDGGPCLWPGAGLFTAMLLLSDRRDWARIVCVAFAVEIASAIIWHEFGSALSVAAALGNAIEAVVAAWLMRRWAGASVTLETPAQVAQFAFFGAVLAPMLGACFGASAMAAQGIGEFGELWVRWWIGDGLGMLVAGPLVIALLGLDPSARRARSWAIGEALLVLAAMAALLHAALSHGLAPFVVLPLLIWAAVRLEVLGAALAIAVMVVVIIERVGKGFWPFAVAHLEGETHEAVLQAFICIAGLSNLLIGAFAAERRSQFRALALTHHRLIRTAAMLRERESDLRAHQRELEARVCARTAELEAEVHRREAAQAELARAQRVETIGQVAGRMAHDMNNLLTVVTGHLEALEVSLANPAKRDALRGALDAIRVGRGLSRRILGYASRRQLEPTRVFVATRVRDLTAMLRRMLGEGIELRVDLASALWDLWVDPGEFDNTLINLATNARDAMVQGGTLTIEVANLNLDPAGAERQGGARQEEYVRLVVRDNGVGMSAETLRHATEAFYTTKRAGEGTGLGLTSVEAFTRQSHGFMTIDSAPGRGTSVSLFLPRHVFVSSTERAHESQGDALWGDGELVLVVEDDSRLREVTLGRIEALGYAVIEAADGEAALALLRRGEPVRLVFSDIVMPGPLSGCDLAGRIRKEWPTVKVLLTTGFDDELRSDSARQAPSTWPPILRKPYDRIELARALRQALTN